MNVRLGMLRFWTVGSVVWIGYGGWRFWQSCARMNGGELWCPTGDSGPGVPDDLIGRLQDFGPQEYFHLALRLFGAPLAVLIVGAALGWATGGFRSRGLHKVRPAKIEARLRDMFEQAGVETVRTLVFIATVNREGLPEAWKQISVPSEERNAALEWLTEKADIAERKEQRVELIEWAILVFVILGVVTDVLLLIHERS